VGPGQSVSFFAPAADIVLIILLSTLLPVKVPSLYAVQPLKLVHLLICFLFADVVAFTVAIRWTA
jgi:hypothetical protein